MSSFASPSPAPFWGRIPRFFLFPLHPTILFRIGLFAAVPVLCVFATSVNAGIVVFAGLSLLVWVFYLRLGSGIFSETSLGRLSPEQYDREKDESLAYIPYAIFALGFIASLIVGLIEGLFGRGPGIAANLIIVSLLMPAALMVLVHTRSLIAGLSPGQVWELISTIGKPYLLLCLFIFCLSSAQMFLAFKCFEWGLSALVEKWMAVQEMLQEIQSEEDFIAAHAALDEFFAFLRRSRPRLGFALFGVNAAAMYFTTVAFNMMGYVLYQYHQALGLTVDEPRQRGQRQAEADPVGNQVADFLAAGQMDKALDAAYEGQRLAPDDAAAQERYHKLLHLAGKTDRLLVHANRLIPLLLRQQKADRAFEALRRCRELSPDFCPEDPAILLALAEAARKQREPKQALDLLGNFDKKYPKHPLIPDAYFLSACILCEDLRQDEVADRVFAAIVTHYAESPCAEQARVYRATLARMKGPGQPAPRPEN
jgi:tetratricopeptide (TPR) repeat protein